MLLRLGKFAIGWNLPENSGFTTLLEFSKWNISLVNFLVSVCQMKMLSAHEDTVAAEENAGTCPTQDGGDPCVYLTSPGAGSACSALTDSGNWSLCSALASPGAGPPCSARRYPHPFVLCQSWMLSPLLALHAAAPPHTRRGWSGESPSIKRKRDPHRYVHRRYAATLDWKIVPQWVPRCIGVSLCLPHHGGHPVSPYPEVTFTPVSLSHSGPGLLLCKFVPLLRKAWK